MTSRPMKICPHQVQGGQLLLVWPKEALSPRKDLTPITWLRLLWLLVAWWLQKAFIGTDWILLSHSRCGNLHLKTLPMSPSNSSECHTLRTVSRLNSAQMTTISCTHMQPLVRMTLTSISWQNIVESYFLIRIVLSLWQILKHPKSSRSWKHSLATSCIGVSHLLSVSPRHAT